MIGPNVNVRVAFVGKLDDGTVFDSSEMNGPLEFMTDCGQVIKGLDKVVQTMDVGETRTVTIPASDAYGEWDERNVQQRELRYIPNAEALPVGQTINFFGPVGQKVPAKVLRVDDTYAYLDFNHRLSGKDLTEDTDIYFYPVYEKQEIWYLTYRYIDNVSTPHISSSPVVSLTIPDSPEYTMLNESVWAMSLTVTSTGLRIISWMVIVSPIPTFSAEA